MRTDISRIRKQCMTINESFSPGVSLFVDSNSEEEIETLFEKLAANEGMVLMPLEQL